MAGFYESLLSYQNPSSIFGNATTVPSIISVSNDNINYLRDSVNQAQNNLAAAQNGYNSLLATQPQQYSLLGFLSNYNNNYADQQNLFKIPAYDTWKSQLSTQQSRLNEARDTLQKNQTALQDAIASQKGQIAAGQDAVSWGLAAKNAEAQGLQNAMQAYQTAMGNESVRNAIMNGAIGTVGNFGGGK